MKIFVAKTTCLTFSLLVAGLVCAWHNPANASSVIFADDFDSDTLAYMAPSLTNWAITSGSIDVIGAGLSDLYPGNGNYLDLDGYENGTIASPLLQLDPGSYELSFDLGQNDHPFTTFDAEVQVSLGGLFNQTFLAPLGAQSGGVLERRTVQFDVTAPTAANLVFQEIGTSNAGGSVLDDVSLTVVPVPAALPLFLSGLFGLGMLARKRGTATA